MAEQQPFVDYFEMNGKQHAMINLPSGFPDSKDFRFGVSKAKLVVKYQKNIQNFINKYGAAAKPAPPAAEEPPIEVEGEQFHYEPI